MYNILKLNLARNSLRYILKEYKIKKLFLPYYLCNVVRKSVFKEGCTPIFYHIDDNFLPQKDFKTTDYILYPNYFGICDKNIELLENNYKNLIVDNAHSFFAKPKGLACFNSARKFLPVFNGSFLWIKKQSLALKEDDNFFDYPKSEKEFLKNENDFENYEVNSINTNVLSKIEKLNLKEIKQNRFLKFRQYEKEFKKYNLLNIDLTCIESPFGYPILFENNNLADNFVEKMTKKEVKIYRYWENLPQNYSEYKFYKRLVILPFQNF